MHTLSCDAVEAILADSALRQRDAAIEPDVAAHLRTCAACRKVYDDYAAIAAGLAVNNAQNPLAKPAPPALKGRVMARVAAIDQARPRQGQQRRQPARPRLAPRLALAGSLAMAFGLIALLFAHEGAERAARIHQLQQGLRGVKVVLAGQPLMSPMTATLAFEPQGNLGVLSAPGLAPLPESQAYQLWLFDTNGVPQPGRTFTAADAPDITIDATRRFADYAAFAVSIEPASGSPQPTGPVVLLGKVSVAPRRQVVVWIEQVRKSEWALPSVRAA